MSQPELININGKNYKTTDLSEIAVNLVNNITVIKNKIMDKQFDIDVFKSTESTLIAQLVAETSKLEEVPEIPETN